MNFLYNQSYLTSKTYTKLHQNLTHSNRDLLGKKRDTHTYKQIKFVEATVWKIVRIKCRCVLVLDKIVIFNYLRIPIIRRVRLANTDTDSYEYR